MRITKETQSDTNIINTLRNLNKLNPSPNIDLSNLHSQEKINNVSNPIKVNVMKNQNRLPIDFVYSDQKKIFNPKDISNTRHSLIYTQEKNNNQKKEKDFFKKVSMSPKLSLRYDNNEEMNDIEQEIKTNKKIKNTPNKNKNNLCFNQYK